MFRGLGHVRTLPSSWNFVYAVEFSSVSAYVAFSMSSAQFEVRQFTSDIEIEEIGKGLLARTLPKEKWTHEAHFAATVYLLRARTDLVLEKEMPRIISSYNVSVGGQNTDMAGYHETLTQFYIRLVRDFLKSAESSATLKDLCNQLVASERARRDFPLRFFSRELLFSVKARREGVEPDLLPLPF